MYHIKGKLFFNNNFLEFTKWSVSHHSWMGVEDLLFVVIQVRDSKFYLDNLFFSHIFGTNQSYFLLL